MAVTGTPAPQLTYGPGQIPQPPLWRQFSMGSATFSAAAWRQFERRVPLLNPCMGLLTQAVHLVLLYQTSVGLKLSNPLQCLGGFPRAREAFTLVKVRVQLE